MMSLRGGSEAALSLKEGRETLEEGEKLEEGREQLSGAGRSADLERGSARRQDGGERQERAAFVFALDEVRERAPIDRVEGHPDAIVDRFAGIRRRGQPMPLVDPVPISSAVRPQPIARRPR